MQIRKLNGAAMSEPQGVVKDGFETLIKPCIDIARIDINLCQSLEEYLIHVLTLRLSPIIFAEAALLVQNSAAIYSKKVDFLFCVVLQFMSVLSKANLCDICAQEHGDDPCTGRTRNSRNSTSANNETPPALEGAPPPKSRKGKKLDVTEELKAVGNVCSDSSISLKLKKFESMKSLVLNATKKVKTDHNLECTTYDTKGFEIGRKDEFRLHWKISEDGLLHEEIQDARLNNIRDEEIDLEISANLTKSFVDDNMNDLDGSIDNCVHLEPVTQDVPLEVNPEDLQISNVPPDPGADADDMDANPVHNLTEIMDLPRAACHMAENVIANVKNTWDPVSFDTNMPEKKFKKRVLKIPAAVEESRESKKRKLQAIEIDVDNFLTLCWVLKEKRIDGKVNNYYDTYELMSSIVTENEARRHNMAAKRKAYNDAVVASASKEFDEDFEGFPDMDPDDDEDDVNGGFVGFQEEDVNMDVPLPAMVDDYDEGREQPVVEFEDDVRKTMDHFKDFREDSRASDMSERVANWHQMILPRLELAESIAHFDIHEYGTGILEQFPEHGTRPRDKTKPFSEIAAGQPKGEVARRFLATLCLANTRNLELARTMEDPLAMDCLELTLLSRTRHHEEMHNNMNQNDNQ